MHPMQPPPAGGNPSSASGTMTTQRPSAPSATLPLPPSNNRRGNVERVPAIDYMPPPPGNDFNNIIRG